MSRSRFRWTRKSYKHAHWLARFMGRHLYELHHQPNLLRRYFELWERHPQKDDPLKRLVQFRLEERRWQDDGLPF
ncbi:hypothetical protein PEC18_18540 [Paucibacter sp. O1-1]|nr:hypothetical protein [Paucibacter sp. O1-1]MDA3827796.1 hypothetical protein [Paucibacter sp. O1-1]